MSCGKAKQSKHYCTQSIALMVYLLTPIVHCCLQNTPTLMLAVFPAQAKSKMPPKNILKRNGQIQRPVCINTLHSTELSVVSVKAPGEAVGVMFAELWLFKLWLKPHKLQINFYLFIIKCVFAQKEDCGFCSLWLTLKALMEGIL